jgi:hypothetical protein
MSQEELLTDESNIIFIEFYNKKNFPPGDWVTEPDFCKWKSYGFVCVAIRDMRLGMWRSFIRISPDHKAYKKNYAEMIEAGWGLDIDFYGNIPPITGKLPAKFSSLNKNYWWVGMEFTGAEDLLPLVKVDLSDPVLNSIVSGQTYKNLSFVRKETMRLAKQLKKIKTL